MFVKRRPAKVLDIGCGDMSHTRYMRDFGIEVFPIDLDPTRGEKHHFPYTAPWPEQSFDGVWACHVLEHCRDPGLFLDKVFEITKVGGVVAISVPPLKHEIVGGHVTLWNAGLLLYQMVLSGFDCSSAAVQSKGYNISVVVEKVPAHLPDLCFGRGDIEAMRSFFPIEVSQGFSGQLRQLNWR